jgi:alkanesulfonate monooxygenase SsuD/methylene tetrahydromethanopterin reductase-like flavin-dependent oxidoreductase (luciferase family)
VQIPLGPGRGTGLGKALKMIPRPARPDVPIYVAASGPRNVAMAAELADGWMPLLFAADNAEAVWGPALREGAARRPPDRPPLEVVAGGFAAIAERPPPAVEAAARSALALYLGGMGASAANYYADLVRRYGLGAEVDRIQRLYGAGDRDGAAAAVPQVLVDETNLIGPPSRVAERVDRLRAAGVTVLDVRIPPGVDAVDQVDRLRRLVG